MWVKLSVYGEMAERIARLDERASQLEERLADKQNEYTALTVAYNELRDDLRKLMGLAPRTAVATSGAVAPFEDTGRTASNNQHIQMSETPRNALSRLQRELDASNEVADREAIRRAIDEFEEVLKN